MTSSDPWNVKQTHIDWSDQVEEELQRGPLPQETFPSLDEAAKTKGGRRKKAAQKISLGEFMAAEKGPAHTQGRPLTDNEIMMMLPKAPKEKDPNAPQSRWNARSGIPSKSSDKLDQSVGYQRGGYDRERRRDRDEDYGGSRADEQEHWGNKSGNRFDRPPSRGSSRGYEDSHRNLDGDWTRENRFQPSRYEERSRRSYGFHSRQDDKWSGRGDSNPQERPRLQLDKRTKPVAEKPELPPAKTKNNPFGDARPREEVLKERGSDVFSSSDQDYRSRSGSPGGSYRGSTVEKAESVRSRKREDPFGGARPREDPFGGARPREEILNERRSRSGRSSPSMDQ